jgi:arylsulfatase
MNNSLFYINKYRALLCGGLASLAGVGDAGAKSGKPSFIVILCDDLGYGDVGCYGNPTISTPNIDRMAAAGLKMTQFYTGAAVSTPSRSALLTGRLPVRNGMYGDRESVLFPDSKAGLGQDETTIATLLRQNGYATACVGKWHLGAFSPYLPTDHGFDFYFGIPYSNDMGPAPQATGRRRNYPPTPLILNDKKIEDEPDQGELTRRYTEQAVDFIEKHAGTPFFLYFAHTFPHVPLHTNSRFRGVSRRGLYGDVVEEIDWSVGEIFRALKAKGIDDNTLVVFTSDNGPWLTKQEHGGSAGLFRNGKGSWWEGGFRVPAVFWMPRVLKAKDPEAVCTAMDLFPTFLDMADIPLPKQITLDGVSMFPWLTGKAEAIRDEVFYWWGSELMAVRKGAWKYYFKTVENQYTPQRKVEVPAVPLLYNLEEDPSERHNRAKGNEQIISGLIQVAENHRKNMKIKDPVCDLR